MSTVVTVRGPLSAGDITQLCGAVDGLLSRAVPVVLALEHCDLTVVDAVARLRVLARRHHAALEVTCDSALLTWCGLP